MGSSPFLLVGAPHRFAVDGDHFGRRLRQRRRPRYETALERDRVEPGEDDAQLVVRGRAVGEASKALQERKLGPAEARNVGHRLRPRQRRRQHQKQHLVERIGDLPLLPVVRQGLEIRQENRRLPHRPGSRVPFRHRPILRPIRGSTTIQLVVHLSREFSVDCPAPTLSRSRLFGDLSSFVFFSASAFISRTPP